ncbi:MAG: hypothetical protein COW73_09915 [Nitrospirae bacterium CG18_big_fil_WC_8_21_14_2_50_70_55]|nr:response regulator [Deltaproteobacteria bacterium]OIP64346.1 MAG: hypothetical protein AUK30_06935 [Nitrospirae bacterium CG2_30_70_394]PIQ03846.1 MAG: hypothetical protein COW73_09915 [Nitrospirae bacterium CG18_big_fil_WC_8_21_14_2_50_70_55]PIU79879.1 MAG: hypothetical protein COS73_02325 [Nitrospirae bacterium CG06_land_8_20_14_3_00_70_43]PIW83607.1 MAG: hypothetical protein COZ96_02490 [Nitrospirae bacterium CG_4_8_14_3_um_filter_70_85]PIX84475.1 MAG: hypothetical protein COZ33_00060 [N
MPSLLIVDDEPLTCWAIGKSLQMAGWRVRCAHSAEAGWELLSEAAADILVADVRLPGEDGIALVARVRERWPVTRCFVITAVLTGVVRARAEQAGAVAALEKPLDLEAFKRTVAAVVPKGKGEEAAGEERLP